MSFGRKIKRLFKTPFKVWFKFRDARAIDPFVISRASGKTGNVRRITGLGDNDTALAGNIASPLLPPVGSAFAKAGNRFFSTFKLAPGCQHAARIPRAGRGSDVASAVVDINFQTLFYKFSGGCQARNARADDFNRFFSCAHHSFPS